MDSQSLLLESPWFLSAPSWFPASSCRGRRRNPTRKRSLWMRCCFWWAASNRDKPSWACSLVHLWFQACLRCAKVVWNSSMCSILSRCAVHVELNGPWDLFFSRVCVYGFLTKSPTQSLQEPVNLLNTKWWKYWKSRNIYVYRFHFNTSPFHSNSPDFIPFHSIQSLSIPFPSNSIPSHTLPFLSIPSYAFIPPPHCVHVIYNSTYINMQYLYIYIFVYNIC